MTGLLTVLLLNAATGAPDDFKGLFEEGEGLFEQGSYDAAVERFSEADRLRETPEVAFDLAKCFQKKGERALEAYFYRLYLRRSPDASDALKVAGIVAEILSRQEAEGRGLLELESPQGRDVTVNGETFSRFPVATFLPPGDYDVLARFPDGDSHVTASILTGRAVTLTLVPPVHVPISAPPLLAVEQGGQRQTLHRSAIALIAVAGAALAAGCIFGAISASDRSQIPRYAQTNWAQAQALTSATNVNATAANVLLGAGAASGVGGGLLFAFTLPEPGVSSH